MFGTCLSSFKLHIYQSVVEFGVTTLFCWQKDIYDTHTVPSKIARGVKMQITSKRGTQANCNSSNWQVELQNEIARHHCSPPMLKSSKGWKEALVLNLRAVVTAMAIAMLAIAAIARPHQVLLQLLQGNRTITWPWLKCIPAAFNNSLIHSINCSHAGYLSLFY